MSEEIKSMYFITGYNIVTRSSRTWFYVLTEKEAREYVKADSELIWEEEFDHCVVEELLPGYVDPVKIKEIWFKYNKEVGVYEEVDKPEQVKNICNFAIG